MRKLMIAGNWKMWGDKFTVAELLGELLTGVASVAGSELLDWVVFPPAPFLDITERMLLGSVWSWGGQRLHPASGGAYTGEISATMLKEFSARYVLIGHSERRTLCAEDDEKIAQQLTTALATGLTPIFCVGESQTTREAGQTNAWINQQLSPVYQAIKVADATMRAQLADMVIAYEPVWAIGSGQAASPEIAQAVHQAIRQQLAECDVTVASQLRILYGGSIKPGNAAALFAMPDIDGGLIGGASLKANSFLAIGKAAL